MPAPTPLSTAFRHSIAVVVGINTYPEGIPQLRSAVNDAQRIGDILATQHGWDVRALLDDAASHARLARLLTEELPQTVGPDDRVLFYFAGHGVAINGDQGPNGYLLPIDARRGDEATYLSMPFVHDALLALPCRHMLVILDSCFSGAFRWSGTRDVDALPETIHRERYERFVHDAAWQVITSAAQDQRALDQLSGGTLGVRDGEGAHSPFALALMEALGGAGDVVPGDGGDGVITATELYLFLEQRLQVATLEAGMRQTPRLWPLAKHDKGEFIFLAPGRTIDLPDAEPLSFDNNPWVGLASYDAATESLFFGRGPMIGALGDAMETQPLLAVLGASGTGKSSLVKAGLLPRLSRDERWHLLPTVRPTASPMASIARAVATIATPDGSAPTDADGMLRTVSDWIATNPTQRLVLVIDQCEELVTMTRREETRGAVLQLLDQLVALPGDRVRVLLTLRTDFEPHFDQSVLAPRWKAARFVITPLDRSQLREVIEKPASARVLYFEPATLVDALLDDVVATPGGLPLLSFALSELYVRYVRRQGTDRALTRDDYDAIGGVVGALRTSAEELYLALDDTQRATMQRVMLRMVSGDSTGLARRRVSTGELEYPDATENGRVAAVLARLEAARLIVRGRDGGVDYVEPAHDALVRAWPRLISWIQQTGDDDVPLVTRTRLAATALEWSPELKTSDALLWSDPDRSALLVPLVKRKAAWLNRREMAFAERSVRGRRVRRAVTIGVTAAMLALGVGSGALGLVASRRGAEAAANGRLATQRGEEALQSARRVRASITMTSLRNESDPYVKALLVASMLDDTLPEPASGVELLSEAMAQLAPREVAPFFNAPAWDLSVLEGQVLRLDPSLLVEWENNPGEGWYEPPRLAEQPTAGRFLPGEFFSFIAGYASGAVQLVHRARRDRAGVFRPCSWPGTERSATRLTGATAAVRVIDVSQDCRRVVAGTDDGQVVVWTLPATGGTPLALLNAGRDRVTGVAISGNGERITAVTQGGTVREWSVAANGATRDNAHATVMAVGSAIAMSSDANVIAVGSSSGATTVWHGGLGGRAIVLDPQRTPDATRLPIEAVGVTSDGSGVVTMAGTSMAVWRADGRGQPFITVGDTATGNTPARVRFSTDGRTVYAAPRGSAARMWSLVLPSATEWKWRAGEVQSLEFSGDGNALTATRTDGSTLRWPGLASAAVAGTTSKWSKVSVGQRAAVKLSAMSDTLFITDGPTAGSRLAPGGRIHAAVVTRDGQRVAITRDSSVSLWSLAASPRQVWSVRLAALTLGEPGEPPTLSLSANDSTLLATHPTFSQIAVTAIRMSTGLVRFTTTVFTSSCVSMSPEGEKLLTCELAMNNGNDFIPTDAVVRTLGDSNGTENALRLPGSGTTIDSNISWGRFSPDGRRIAVRGGEGRLQLWSSDGTGKPLVLGGGGSAVQQVAFSPDGRLLALALGDSTVRVVPATWALAAGAVRGRVAGCLSAVERISLLSESDADASARATACVRRRRLPVAAPAK